MDSLYFNALMVRPMAKNTAEHLKARFIEWLLKGNLSFDTTKDAIGVEVSFSANKRKADLVVMGKELHAFEIKGDQDNLRKLKNQISDYNKTFDRVSIVTSIRHLVKIRKLVSRYTGLITVKDNNFKVIRKTKLRRRLNKQSLLMFFPKTEVASLLGLSKLDKYSTDKVRFMAQKLSLRKIRRASLALLKKRYGKLFGLFMSDKGDIIHIDDLLSLTGKVKDLIS
jgi:hypothetical protein